MKKIIVFLVALLVGVPVFCQNSKSVNNKKAQFSSIYDLIRMKPGVQVNESDGSITIRGVGTNSAYTQPLFIIDDIRGDANRFSNLNPDEVWSVEVIKDGSASFYGGMESANGVIVVETKGYHEIKEARAAQEKAEKQAKRQARKNK